MRRRLAAVAACSLALVACEEPASKPPPKPSATAAQTAARPVAPKPLATSPGPAPSFAPAPPMTATEGPKQVTLAFAPITRPFTVDTVRKKRKSRPGSAEGPAELVRTVQRVRVTADGDHYVWKAEPVSFTVHGHRQSRIDELVAGFPVGYRLDERGAVVDVQGFDDILARAQKTLSARNVKAMGAMLNPETLRRTRAQEWTGRVGEVVGKTFEVGKPVVTMTEVALAKGGTKTHTVTRLSGWTSCALGKCVKIETAYDTDREALAKRTGIEIPEPDAGQGGSDGHDHAHGDAHDHGDAHGKGGPGKGGPGKGGPGKGGPGQKPAAQGPPLGYAGRTIRILDPETSMPVWERVERVINLAGMASLSDEIVIVYDYGPSVE
jgi:hypothetical protein